MKKKQYGPLHSVADFIDKTIPEKSAIAPKNQRYILNVIKFLRSLDAIERSNPSMVFSYTADGIFIYFRRQEIGHLRSAQKNVAFAIRKSQKNEKWVRAILKEEKKGDVFNRGQSISYGFRKYFLDAPEFDWIIKNFPKYLKPTSEDRELALKLEKQSRFFPYYVRAEALKIFEDGGRYCAGYKRKPHKVKKGMQIEYDHILPHSRGGSNRRVNCQVLCWECNRAKGNN